MKKFASVHACSATVLHAVRCQVKCVETIDVKYVKHGRMPPYISSHDCKDTCSNTKAVQYQGRGDKSPPLEEQSG